jgi:hypothetical protein
MPRLLVDDLGLVNAVEVYALHEVLVSQKQFLDVLPVHLVVLDNAPNPQPLDAEAHVILLGWKRQELAQNCRTEGGGDDLHRVHSSMPEVLMSLTHLSIWSKSRGRVIR